MQTTYRVTCRRPTFLLNALMRAGVSMTKISVKSSLLRFKVKYACSGAVDALLTDLGFSFEKSGYIGKYQILRRVVSRPFLAFSVLLSLCSVIVFGNFVYGYSISGNRRVNTARVEEVLLQNGVDGFVWKGKVDLSAIKRDVSKIEGVSFASVRLEGSRLRVEIKEELPRETPEEPRFTPVTSLYSAVVTKVVAGSGTPIVKAGDRVSPGDVLVAPVFAFTEGEAPAPAAAEVWGRVTYQKEAVLPLYSVESVLTGRIFRARVLHLLGREVGKAVTPPFADYESSERVLYRRAGVLVSEILFRERNDVSVFHDFDVAAPALIRSALCSLLLSVPFSAEERGEVRVEQKKLDNVLYIVLYYTTEQRIDSLFVAR